MSERTNVSISFGPSVPLSATVARQKREGERYGYIILDRYWDWEMGNREHVFRLYVVCQMFRRIGLLKQRDSVKSVDINHYILHLHLGLSIKFGFP